MENTLTNKLNNTFDKCVKLIDRKTQLLTIELILTINDEFADFTSTDKEELKLIQQCKNRVNDYLIDTLPTYE
nr:hypothetical protein [uncultured Bacteroides sp.]